ncbi:YveK family protein [Paenibacillus thermotolerans]|uniref:YveK family protein n=1 Tax=Paenibacillus thermotolerans TaxID=3027807 RepID=UPI0023679FCD|nr:MULTISPECIES: Wzz/FepE/Etk N-terminal domain-containing protein [unclassified Paenibacillus]
MELELKDYGRILKKWLWLIALVVIVSCTATAIVSYYFMQPVYQASTKIIVNKSDDNAGIIQQLNVSEMNANILLISTYKEIIRTTAIMDKVVEQHPEFKLTAEKLIDKVKVSSVNNTQVMTITVEDYSYKKAVNIANAVSKVFKQSIPTIMKVDNVKILNEAKMIKNPKPVKPNPVLNIIISFVAAFMFSIGVVFLIEYLDDTIKSEEDIGALLGVPTLAVIAVMKQKDIHPRKVKASDRKVGEVPYATVNH